MQIYSLSSNIDNALRQLFSKNTQNHHNCGSRLHLNNIHTGSLENCASTYLQNSKKQTPFPAKIGGSKTPTSFFFLFIQVMVTGADY